MNNLLTFLFMVAGFAIYKAQNCSSLEVNDALGNESVYVDCNYPITEEGCVSLIASFPEIRNTTSYQVTSIPFVPYIPFNSGTPLNANFDDIYPEKVVLPFKFCFFGQYYDQVVIGSNGLITFDLSRLGKISYPNVEYTNPHPLLPGNSIYGVFQDLVFSNSDQSEIYYSIIGTQFCRKLVINFYEGRNAGCQDRSSTQIVISEFTNEIEVFVDKKPIPCETAKFENTLLGIMNADGTLGYSPAGRNTGIWQAFQEGWKFSPDGEIAVPDIEWFDESNNSLGFGTTQVVCPSGNTKYTAKATFDFCGGPVTVADTIDVNFAPDFPLAKNYTKTFCKIPSTPENVNLNDYRFLLTPQNPDNLLFTFHLSLEDAQQGINPQDPNVSLSSDTSFYVRVQNPSDEKCFRTAELKFLFVSDVMVGNLVEICDSNNDGVENSFLISNLTPQLLPAGFTGNVTYFATQSNAQNNLHPLVTANITSATTLWLRITTGSCVQISGPVTVNFTPGPNVTTPIDYEINICDINDDKAEPYDFHLLISPLITTDPNLTLYYYATYQQAFNKEGGEISTVKQGKYSIFVRVEEAGGCFSIVEIKLDVKFSKVEVVKKDITICFDGTEDVSVDLNALSQGMLLSPAVGITKSYHPNAADAEAGINPISANQTVTENGNLVTKNYFVRFERSPDCYTIRPITIVLTHPFAAKNNFGVCDTNNDSTENVNLTQFNNAIAGAQRAAVVTWFRTSDDAYNNSSAITSFQMNGSTTQLFIRITVNGCTEIYPITLNLVATPPVVDSLEVHLDNVCDNNNDGKEIYNLTAHQNQIFSGSQPVKFAYYTGYNPSNNTFTGLISNPNAYNAGTDNIIYVKVQVADGECFSVSVLKLTIKFLPSIILSETTIAKCDEQFNFNEEFILNDAIPAMYDASQNSIPLSDITVTYYASNAEAQAGLASSQISSNYRTKQSLITVYARFQSKLTGCYSVKPIHLRTYFPPKALNSKISGICDADLDGSYEVNLTNFTAQMVDMQNSENKFKFYTSLTDAQNNVNPVPDPTNFEVNPFPAGIWVKVENIPGCQDIAYIDLQTNAKIPVNTTTPYIIEVCDNENDGTETVDLTQYESQIYAGGIFEYYPTLTDLNNATNLIVDPSNFTFVSGANQVFVKVNKTGFCPALVKIGINFRDAPVFSVPTQYLCPDSNSTVDIKPDFSGLNLVSYEWRNPLGQVVSTTNQLLGVSKTGIYAVKVIAANGCGFTSNFEVKYSEVPVITNLVPNGNSYTIVATGSKPILYSKDGLNWQTSNVFYNIQPGITTFYVKFDGENCIGLPKKGVILNIPNAFTPDEDGINDTWQIEGLEVFDGQKSRLQVFDRQQTLVFEQFSSNKFIWNGQWLSRKVPTTSYWYIITLPDGRVFNGWVFIKNRN